MAGRWRKGTAGPSFANEFAPTRMRAELAIDVMNHP